MRAEELGYQAARAAHIKVRPTAPDILRRYRELRHWRLFPKEFLYKALGDLRGKTVLDFGCGEGEVSVQLANLGAMVTGIDISPELVDLARQRARLDGFDARFYVGDLAELDLGRFDVVVAKSVLHHVDIAQTLPKLLNSVQPGGLFATVEPINFSPALRRLRCALPVSMDASPDEQPLTSDQVQFVIRHLSEPAIRYFRILGRLDRWLPLWALRPLLRVDNALMALPGMQRFCSVVVIVGRPRAQQESS